MAQLERIKPSKHVDIEQHHGHGEHIEARWVTTPTTPTLRKDHDQEEDHYHYHHHRHRHDNQNQSKKSISVLAKVKEKAKKWRHNLVNKKNKHGHDHSTHTSSNPSTPAWGVSLEDDDDDDNYVVDDDDQDPEYFGAPMYESEQAPEGLKETVSQHPRTNTPHMVSDKHVMSTTQITITSTTPPPHPPPKEQEEEIPDATKTITESVTEKLAPAYAKVSEATQLITSTFQNATIPTFLPPMKSDEISSTGDHQWDKGVSVKEYLMQKLEPGDEEKALSEVISDAISPKTITGDTGVVEKVREAVSTMLGIEPSTPSLPTTTTDISPNVPTSTANMSPHVPLLAVNISPPRMSPTTANMSPLIPLSTNAQEVTVEANQERRLQAN